MNGLRSHIKNSKESFIRYPNTSKSVKKTRLRLVFSAHFSGFGYPDETLFLVFDILHLQLVKSLGQSSPVFVVSATFSKWGHGSVVVSVLDFRSEGRWFEGRNSTSTLSLSPQVYKWVPATHSWGGGLTL